MINQFIMIGDHDWGILLYYNVAPEDLKEVAQSLKNLDCPKKTLNKILKVLGDSYNTGCTFSNGELKMSIICIGEATSAEQFINTAVHEIDHVQNHICEYYGVDNDGESAAQLIGYIALQMYKPFTKIIKQYV